MRASTVGSCCSAGRYSLCTIDGGTFQVGLTVMYFIVSVSSGVAMRRLADHDPGGPERRAVLASPCSVKSGMLTIDIGLAEIARIPAPALHVGEDDVDLLARGRAVELA